MKLLKWIAVPTFALAASAGALELRDEANSSDNQRFIGSLAAPASVVANSSFILSGFDTTGVAQHMQDSRRQFAMVSPRHFVCATHFRPGVNHDVRFLGTDGVVYTYNIQGTEIIADAGGNTDLSLGTLSTPIDTAVLTSFRYANLGGDTNYAGPGFIFGLTTRAGRTTFGAVNDLNGTGPSASFNNTRYIETIYTKATGNPDDAFLQGGDSGSPSFLDSNGELALVSVNSLSGENDFVSVGFATFVPFYVDELNTLMADEGFQMSALNPASTSLSLSEGITTTLREAYPGCIALEVSNSGSQRATNLELRFNSFSSLPDSIVGDDVVQRSDGSGDLIANRAFLDSGQSFEVLIKWDSLPSVTNLSFAVTLSSDEDGDSALSVSQALLPSFLSFVSSLVDQSNEGDDDQDGVSNLIEYALGGDVTASSQTTADGTLLNLDLIGTATGAELSFLRRTDAVDRGLTYTLWSGTNFPLSDEVNLSTSTIETASEPGFDRVRLTIPSLDDDAQIYRLGVALDEVPVNP